MRHKTAIFGIVSTALILAGVGYLYFRDFEPDRSRFPVRGIDVSHHQGRIDWSKVAADDVAFAYVKFSEGGDHRDTQYGRNIDGARGAGLAVGAYHFFTFCRPGIDQANNFVGALSDRSIDLPMAVDLEFYGNCDRRPSPAELAQELNAFLRIVEDRTGRPAIFYVTSEFLEAYGQAIADRGLWVRSILSEPDVPDWLVWQYRPAGRVSGIGGDVDLNVLSGTLEKLVKP
jgi:lysozyme